MPVRMPVRQTPVPAGDGRGQPEPGEKDPTSEATGVAKATQATRVRPVWDGRDVSFPPLRPTAGRPAQPGGEAREGATGSGRAAQVLAVTGARGGLGASVLLLHLAWALGRAGRRVAMMDLDPTGGLDLLCGQSVLTGLRWADLPAEESAFRPGRLVGALPVWHAMPVLTGDVRGGPLPCADAVLDAMRAEHDVVLVDLPRGAPPPPGAGVLILTGLDLRSAVAAESIASRLRGMAPAAAQVTDAEAAVVQTADTAAGVPVWLVARQVGEDVVAEDLELITGCPVLGQVPTDRVLAKRVALGEDPVRARSAIRRAAGSLARELLPRLADATTPGSCSARQSTNQPANQSGHQSRRQSWSR